MCRVCYNQCRFCERESIDFVDLCLEGRTGNICLDSSFHLDAIGTCIDTTSRTLKAADALPHVKRRYTCSTCEDLIIHVIHITPGRLATIDINDRTAFSWLHHYYCPALLDAIYTTAQTSLVELQSRLTNGTELLRWEPESEDYDRNLVDDWDDLAINKSWLHNLMVPIVTADRTEHEEELLDGGEMGSALLKQEKRERQQLSELIVLRRYLRNKVDARQIKEYKVICHPEDSPIEHVRVATIAAATGGTLCRGVRLREVAERVSEWEHYFDVALCAEKRRSFEPKPSSRLLWVDRGYGRQHPPVIPEIVRLTRRQRLEGIEGQVCRVN
jgi:hypothetical protein